MIAHESDIADREDLPPRTPAMSEPPGASEIAGSPANSNELASHPPPLSPTALTSSLPTAYSPLATGPLANDLLTSLLLHNHNLSAAIADLKLSAHDLLTLARSCAFKSDLADLRELLFITARMQAVSDLQKLSANNTDPVEQRRISTAILRATSPALMSSGAAAVTAATGGVEMIAGDAGVPPASSPPHASGRAPSPASAGENVAKRQVRASSPTASPPSTPSSTAHCLLPIASSLPTHSTNDLIEHLIGKLQDPDDYADELEEELDDDDFDDLDEDRDPRDYAFLALHAAFALPAFAEQTSGLAPLSPALRGEVPASSPAVRGYSSSTPSDTNPDSSSTNPPPSSSPTPDTPLPTPASFDGSPVPSDPSSFLSLIDTNKRDDLTNFAAAQRYVEDDEPLLYTERICFAHADGRDVFRRFTFHRADKTAPWRLTLVEPYDPEDIDPSDGYEPDDNDSDTS